MKYVAGTNNGIPWNYQLMGRGKESGIWIAKCNRFKFLYLNHDSLYVAFFKLRLRIMKKINTIKYRTGDKVLNNFTGKEMIFLISNKDQCLCEFKEDGQTFKQFLDIESISKI